MVFGFAVGFVAAVVLVLFLMKRRGRGDGRGDLLGPPPSLGKQSTLASPRPVAPAAGGGGPTGVARIDDPPDDVVAEVRLLMAQNQKLEAVKLVREARPGWSLGEAKEWVERL